MTTVAVPGTFDPITLGHVSLVRRATKTFGDTLVAVATGVHKRTLFTLDERIGMVRECFAGDKDVTVAPVEGLLVDFLRERGCKVVLRGLRAVSDFELETQLAFANRKLYPDLETLLMMPDQAYTHIHSSLVREIATFGGDIGAFVPPHVRERVVEKIRSNSRGG